MQAGALSGLLEMVGVHATVTFKDYLPMKTIKNLFAAVLISGLAAASFAQAPAAAPKPVGTPASADMSAPATAKAKAPAVKKAKATTAKKARHSKAKRTKITKPAAN